MKQSLLLLCVLILNINLIFSQKYPCTGSFYTGNYRNLFEEAGHSSSEVDTKVNSVINHYFNGGSDAKLYYESGSDEAYILDVNNDDVRSEGQSYGMMIAVQMNMKDEFDRLWRFAKRHMQHTSGSYDGYFRWQVDKTGSEIDAAMAPDGEVYFITSLLFASERWGDGTGILDYRAEAENILTKIMNKGWNTGQVTNMFNPNKLICFQACNSNNTFTDPSYHVPAFFQTWAYMTGDDYWKQAADASRAFWDVAANSTTGLMSDYTQYNGTPHAPSWNTDAEYYMYDAHRCIMNMAFDYAWFQSSGNEVQICTKLQNFFSSEGMTTYDPHYEIDGTPYNPETWQAGSQVACNAVGSLVSGSSSAGSFVEALWNMTPVTGQYRYYDGMMHMLAILHCSGKFKAYYYADPYCGVELEKDFVRIKKGDVVKMNYTVHPPNAPNKDVYWWPADPSVANVDQKGNIIGLDPRFGSWVVVSTKDGCYFDDVVTIDVYEDPNPAPPSKSTIALRARGNQGGEHLNLLINGYPVNGGWILSTDYEYFSALVSGDGDINVGFDNDNGGARDIQLDCIYVNGKRSDAENMEYNTGAYANNYCGGGSYTEWLHCNGVIGFGMISDYFGPNTITIRAKGTQGGEHIDLLINGSEVNNGWWLSTSFQEYKATVNGDGDINIQFDNDGTNKDVIIDWVKVNNQDPRQAENMEYNTAAYANGVCGGGSYTEWMHCNGVIGFGNIYSNFKSIRPTEIDEEISDVTIYPNPNSGEFTIDLTKYEPGTEIKIIDLTGKVIYTNNNVIENKVMINGLDKGIYILKISMDGQNYSEKLIVN